MLVIGLTGPSGAGKGEVARLLASHSIPVVDADRVYHQLLVPPSPCLDALCAHFGTQILSNEGTLDRIALGAIVFSDPNALADLNAIAHRFVMDRVRAILAEWKAAGVSAAVLDAPQLFEAGADRDCDTIVAVLADKHVRLARIMKRDGISAERAEARMKSQLSDEFFRAHAQHVIENEGELNMLAQKVRALLLQLGVAICD